MWQAVSGACRCSLAMFTRTAAEQTVKAWHRLCGVSLPTSLLSLLDHPRGCVNSQHITQNPSGGKLVNTDINPDPIGGSPSPPRPRRRRRCSTAGRQLQGEALPGALPPATSFDRLDERCRQLLGVGMKKYCAGAHFNRRRAETLLANLETIHMQLGPQVTRAIALKDPYVFLRSSNTLGARVHGVKTLMCAGDDDAFLTLVLEHPSLLRHDPNTMARKGEQLSDILDLTLANAFKLFLKHPVLLNSNSCSLQRNVHALSTRLGMSKLQCRRMIERFPKIIMYNAGSIHAKFVALQGLVGDMLAKGLVVEQPSLLDLDREHLATKVHVMYKLFGRDEALSMLQAKPALLVIASEALTAKWRSIELLAQHTGPLNCKRCPAPALPRCSHTAPNATCGWLRSLNSVVVMSVDCLRH